MDYDAASELFWLDSDQGVSISASPRFKVERSKPLTFFEISYTVSAAGDHYAPTFAHSFINAIYFKAHQLHLDSGGLGFVGAKYDLTFRKLEIHGQSHRASLAQKYNASYPSYRQVGIALLLCERFQQRVSSGASMAGRPIDFSTQEGDRCRVESERYQVQSASTQRCIRTSFEVAEVHRIDTSA